MSQNNVRKRESLKDHQYLRSFCSRTTIPGRDAMRYLTTTGALVFMLGTLASATNAQIGTLTTLVNFNGSNGSTPVAKLTMDSQGNIYGTTYSGGTNSDGVVFKISSNGVYTKILDFGTIAASLNPGANPYSDLTFDSDGNMYGTTTTGGKWDNGTVFKISNTGVYSTLYSFNGTDGYGPYGGVVRDAAGNLYGTTLAGGTSGKGNVFKLDKFGNLTQLVQFDGTNGDQPYGKLAIDASGNLYGTTIYGGSGPVSSRFGTVFKISANGTFSTLQNFNGTNGYLTYSDITLDNSGNLYGTSYWGNGSGNIFKISSSGVFSTVFSFGGDYGTFPYAGVTIDQNGNLYGVASSGGASPDPSKSGTLYQISANGTYTKLYDFSASSGYLPKGDVLLGANGTIFGTTSRGGSGSSGTVFQFTPNTPQNVPEPTSFVLAVACSSVVFVVGKRRVRTKKSAS